MRFYTYLYIDPNSNLPVYVGKGHGTRWKCHIWANTRFGRLMRKRIREGFDMIPLIFERDSEDDAFALEVALITYIGREDRGQGTLFNLTDGGEGSTGGPGSKGRSWTVTNRRQVSSGMKGKPQTALQRAIASANGKGNTHARNQLRCSCIFCKKESTITVIKAHHKGCC